MASKKRRTWQRRFSRFWGLTNPLGLKGVPGFVHPKGLDVNHRQKPVEFFGSFGPEIRRMTSKLMIFVILFDENLTFDKKSRICC